MPQFVALSKRNEKKGLVVVGVHTGGGEEEPLLKVVKQLRLKFPVTAGGSSPVKYGGIPHSFVFDRTGEMLFDGHPSDKDFDRAVRTAVKDAPEEEEKSALAEKGTAGPLVAERTWTNADGKTMAATLLSIDGTTGKFRRKDGSSFTYDISKLSGSDQELVEKANSSAEEGPADK